MGTVFIGKCECQCYINYVSCDYTFQNNELNTEIRTNRFTEKEEKKNQIIKKSSGNSSEKLSRFSSTRKQSSRSNSLQSKYLQSNECNIETDESSQFKLKRIPRINPQFVKSSKLYKYRDIQQEQQSNIYQQSIILTNKNTYNPLVQQIVQNNQPFQTDKIKEEINEDRPFNKANKHQQLFFK